MLSIKQKSSSAMKIQTTKRLMFSLVLSGMGFAALVLSLSATAAQSKSYGLKLSQLGYGHTPHAPLITTSGLKLSQLGYGHAPHNPNH